MLAAVQEVAVLISENTHETIKGNTENTAIQAALSFVIPHMANRAMRNITNHRSAVAKASGAKEHTAEIKVNPV
jgi:hypothetical protein